MIFYIYMYICMCHATLCIGLLTHQNSDSLFKLRLLSSKLFSLQQNPHQTRYVTSSFLPVISHCNLFNMSSDTSTQSHPNYTVKQRGDEK